MLRLASQPEMTEKLYKEQTDALGSDKVPLRPLEYADMERMPLLAYTIKETLRIHTPIHTLMRKVKNPLPVPGTNYVVPTSHTLLSSPGFTARDDRYFRNPMVWNPHRWESRVDVLRWRMRQIPLTMDTVLCRKEQRVHTCLLGRDGTGVSVRSLPI